jgi:phosphoribosylformylglycinamidine cyclo-ligase
MPEEPLTYRAAGVDIDEAGRALRSVVGQIQGTYTEDVVAGVGGFGGLFRAHFPGCQRPLLVSSIDGIGTKTKVAAMVGDYSGLGKDIVNHCVNDILCQGAKPLFFMDYFGTSHLTGRVFEAVLLGLSEACSELGVALIGGETAEMPGVYVEDEIDLVGSIVGLVDHDKKLPRGNPVPGSAVIGIAAVGLHTNGFSLARRALFELGGLSVRDKVPGMDTTIGEELLRPHRCYYQAVYPVLQEMPGIYGVAHITGGGLYDNLPRVIPSGLQAMLERRAWTTLPIFRLIQEVGGIADQEMYRAFNMGIGMALIVDKDIAHGVVQRLNAAGEAAAVIGELQKGSHDVQII